jgi:hypothetical protein
LPEPKGTNARGADYVTAPTTERVKGRVWILGIKRKRRKNYGEQDYVGTVVCYLLIRDVDYVSCELMDSGFVGRRDFSVYYEYEDGITYIQLIYR